MDRITQQLARIDQRDLIRMRSNVRAMVDDALSYDAVAKRLRVRIGVMDQDREVI